MSAQPWISDLLTGYTKVLVGGSEVSIPVSNDPTNPTICKKLNFVAGATAAYNATTGTMDITVASIPLDGTVGAHDTNVAVVETTANVVVKMYGLTATRTATIPATGGTGQRITIKLDASGASYPVTVTAGGTTHMDGSTTITVSGAYAQVTLSWTNVGTLEWSIV